MRTLIRVLLFFMVGFFIGYFGTQAIVEASYPAQVQNARHWAREHINSGQWRCLHVLWDKESHWSVHGTTPEWKSPARAAYGIPQSLPGRKMKAAERPKRGPKWDDYVNDALVQVSWGLNYIRGRYGTPCHARAFQRRNVWY